MSPSGVGTTSPQRIPLANGYVAVVETHPGITLVWVKDPAGRSIHPETLTPLAAGDDNKTILLDASHLAGILGALSALPTSS